MNTHYKKTLNWKHILPRIVSAQVLSDFDAEVLLSRLFDIDVCNKSPISNLKTIKTKTVIYLKHF